MVLVPTLGTAKTGSSHDTVEFWCSEKNRYDWGQGTVNAKLTAVTDSVRRQLSLAHVDQVLVAAIARTIVSDLTGEFGKIRWLGNDDGWNQAMLAVTNEIQNRYL